MTTTTEQAPPLLVSNGHLCCAFCDTRYDYTLVEGSALTPRQQLRQAASRDGWKQTVADLDACPTCASAVASMLITGWSLFWAAEHSLPEWSGTPVMNGDDEQTTTIPAVVEDAA